MELEKKSLMQKKHYKTDTTTKNSFALFSHSWKEVLIFVFVCCFPSGKRVNKKNPENTPQVGLHAKERVHRQQNNKTLRWAPKNGAGIRFDGFIEIFDWFCCTFRTTLVLQKLVYATGNVGHPPRSPLKASLFILFNQPRPPGLEFDPEKLDQPPWWRCCCWWWCAYDVSPPYITNTQPNTTTTTAKRLDPHPTLVEK